MTVASGDAEWLLNRKFGDRLSGAALFISSCFRTMVNRNRASGLPGRPHGSCRSESPEREPAAYNHDNRADQGCHKAVDTPPKVK